MTSAWRIPLSDLEYDEAEERAVLEVLRSKWLTMGPMTAEFEGRLADFLGVRHVVAVANCTAALELAFCIVAQKDTQNPRLVLMPTLTFVATANAALAAGLKPVLLDSRSPSDPRIDPEQVEEFFETEWSHASPILCTMHYGGVDADADRLRRLADAHHTWLIEDAAHAVGGATLDGKPLGSFGHIGCFSFFSNKNLATGEGGALVTNDDEVARLARLIRSHGLSSGTVERHHARTASYDVLVAGHNYRWNEIAAALGLVQLTKLPQMNTRRRELLARYAKNLSGVDGVHILFASPEYLPHSAAHLAVAVFETPELRDRVRSNLHRHGIQTSHHYTPVHMFTAYQRLIAEGRVGVKPCPRAERFAATSLTLPLFAGLNEQAVDEICCLIRETLVGTPHCS
jgi:dTDP-4-amino-4,6-dideoxygalactose transaminase